MAELHVLSRADFDALDAALGALLEQSGATAALLVEKAGYLVHQCGHPERFDAAAFAALGSNAFNALHFMAELIEERNFTSFHQEGENASTLMLSVDERFLLVLVFPTRVTLGAVKDHAVPVARTIAAQFQQTG